MGPIALHEVGAFLILVSVALALGLSHMCRKHQDLLFDWEDRTAIAILVLFAAGVILIMASLANAG